MLASLDLHALELQVRVKAPFSFCFFFRELLKLKLLFPLALFALPFTFTLATLL